MNTLQRLGFYHKEYAQLLKPHQKAIVQWALHGGQRAIFAAFGLGKTFIQLEIGRLVLTGYAADICVLFTAGDAHMRGYDLWVPANATASIGGSVIVTTKSVRGKSRARRISQGIIRT